MANTPLDDALVPVAFNLLDEFGMDAFYVEPGVKTHNPKTGKVTEGAEVRIPIKIIPPTPINEDNVDGDLRQIGDMETGIANQGLTFTPTLGRVIEFVSEAGVTEKWTIEEANRVKSGNLIALWEILLRK